MQPPCELMVTTFLPNIRGVVSHELRLKGESQHTIAKVLGITQARVSYYLAEKKSFFENQISSKFGISINDVETYGKILAEDAMRSQADGIFTLYSIWKNLLFSGSVCAAHQAQSGVPVDCSVCMELHRPQVEVERGTVKESEDAIILRDISQAISIVEDSPYFPYIMPEVSVNVAMARENPRTSRDIAAIPGRISKIHGRAKAFVPPEFGCSNHMSKVLLVVNSKNTNLRAALNVKYDANVEKALDELSIPTKVTIEPKPPRSPNISNRPVSSPSGFLGSSVPDAPVIDRIAATKLSPESGRDFLVLIDRGSQGLEPMTYLMGKRPSELAQLATKIAEVSFGYQMNSNKGKE